MRRELERIEIPGEHEARERSWALVQAAFAERERVPRRRGMLVPAVAVLAAAVAVGAVTSPGRAVLDEVRDAVLPTRVERAQPALFSLPGGGRVLATSGAGAWVVQANGSRRLLGTYEAASWSPFGVFVVASRANELTALEPDGDVRWSLSRPNVGPARWGGTRVDTRIAYASGDELRLVGGDGRGDRRLFSDPDVDREPVAWKPGGGHVLAHWTQGALRVVAADRGGEELWSTIAGRPLSLEWSSGNRKLVATARGVSVFTDERVAFVRLPGVVAAAWSPDGRRIAVLRRTELLVFDARLKQSRRLFAGTGRLEGLAWSPDGRWLLAGWPTADQWLFVRAAGKPSMRAVSNVSAQFRSQSFPRIEGWCCAG